MNYTCHTGGAIGSDGFFERVSIKYGIKVVAYSFKEHNSSSLNRKILTISELIEGWDKAQSAAKDLKRNTYNLSAYIKKLLSRNWFQVKNSDSIFAVGYIINPKEKGERITNKTSKQIVDGGTGYCCTMAIQHNKPVNVFNQKDNKWYKWDYSKRMFVEQEIPTLTTNFAGVGTRNLTIDGAEAIQKLFKNSFKI